MALKGLINPFLATLIPQSRFGGQTTFHYVPKNKEHIDEIFIYIMYLYLGGRAVALTGGIYPQNGSREELLNIIGPTFISPM